MPASIASNQVRDLVRSLAGDHSFSPADAVEVKTRAAELALPVSELAQILTAELSPDHFESGAAGNSILGAFGLSVADLRAPGASSVFGKLKKELLKIVDREVHKGRDFDLKILDGEHAGLQLKTRAQIFRRDDPLISDDRFRSATQLALMAEGAPAVNWVSISGGVYPRAGFDLRLQGHGGFVSAGFSADASIGYSVLGPYKREVSELAAVLKDASVDLPYSAKNAKELLPGSEVLLRGKGRITANVGAGIGAELASVGDLISVGASAGINIGHTEERELAVRVKRLDKQQVFVSISKVAADASNVGVSAQVGVDLRLRDNLPDLGGSLFQKAGEIAAKSVEKQIEKWASADFRASHQVGHTEREVVSYVLDLSNPQAAKAYESLIKLDLREADKLLQEWASTGALAPVRRTALDENIRSEENALSAHFGPITLLSRVSRAETTTGVLHTSEGDIAYNRTDLRDAKDGLISGHFSGKRELARSLISTTYPNQPPEYHYQFRYSVEGDNHTSSADIREFLTMAEFLGGAESALSLKGLKGDKKFLESFDDSDRVLDVFFTHQGLEKLVATSDPELMRAYARAYEAFEQPADPAKPKQWQTTPWVHETHPQHAEAMSVLNNKVSQWNTQSGRGSQVDPREAKYRQITGRSLTSDATALRDARKFVGLVKKMREAPSPEKRVRLLGDQNKELGLDFWKGLSAVAQAAGPENTLVDLMRIHDKDQVRDVTLFNESALQDIHADLRARVDAPS